MKTQTQPKTVHTPVLIVIGVMALVLGVLVWFTINSSSAQKTLPADLAATYLPQGKPITGVNLVDHNNQPFTETRFKGKWNFLFFGFTNCPDICPTTLLVMKSVWAKLPKTGEVATPAQMYFVSVDPNRDTPDKLKNYVQYYQKDFVGVTGKLDNIDMLTNQLNVLYGYEDAEEGSTNYVVNHSSQIILVDPKGQMRAVLSTPHIPEEIVKSFKAIQAYYSG